MKSMQRITIGPGVAVWPKLREPDTRFDPLGVYSCKLRLTKAQGEALVKQLKAILKDAYTGFLKETGKKQLKVSDLPVQPDPDDENSYIVSTKLKAKVESRSGSSWEQRPAVFDAKGVPIRDDAIPNIGGGSKLKLACDVATWHVPSTGVGLSLRLKGCQVLELVEFGSGEVSANAMGFDSEESGWISGGESFDSVLTNKTEEVKVESTEDVDEIPF